MHINVLSFLPSSFIQLLLRSICVHSRGFCYEIPCNITNIDLLTLPSGLLSFLTYRVSSF